MALGYRFVLRGTICVRILPLTFILLNEILNWKISVLEDEAYVIWLLCFQYPEVKASDQRTFSFPPLYPPFKKKNLSEDFIL
jgi:hypothetical protein